MAILLHFLFVYLFLTEGETAANQEYPFLENMSQKLEMQKNKFMVYPLFVAIALFFYWSFDKAILTLLWTVEILSVFVLSIVLREKQFRHISMAAMIVIVGRLVFYDMDQVEAIFKIFVFIGVGGMLILMNYLYNKYKDRY